MLDHKSCRWSRLMLHTEPCTVARLLEDLGMSTPGHVQANVLLHFQFCLSYANSHLENTGIQMKLLRAIHTSTDAPCQGKFSNLRIHMAVFYMKYITPRCKCHRSGCIVCLHYHLVQRNSRTHTKCVDEAQEFVR